MGETTDEVRSANDTGVERSAVRQGVSSTDGDLEASQIRAGIERTRGDLSETIEALQEKLDPTRIAEQVKDQIREKATEAYDTAKNTVKEATIGRAEKIVSSVSEAVNDMTGRAGIAVKDSGSSLVQYIRENPIPFALVGIGLGMLTLNKRKTGQYSYESNRDLGLDTSGVYGGSNFGEEQSSLGARAQNLASGVAETARGAAARATDAVSSATSTVRDAVGGAADTTRRKFHDVRDQAAQGAQTAGDRFKNTLQENPMALGIAALAAGAIVGLTVPSTRLEGEYMGEARDRLVDQAKSVAQETAEKIQHVAADAGNTVKESVQREGLLKG